MRASDADRERVEALLDSARAAGRRIVFWWRDDDAETPTPALDRLLDLSARRRLPLALAVIPDGATDALAERIRDEPLVAVLQHGWRHENHAPPGTKKVELGADRPTDEMLAELAAGREKLARLFGQKFLPILVPPWNRIAPDLAARLDEAGLVGLSTFGACAPGAPRQTNAHLDIFDWKTTRRPLGREPAFAILDREIERRLAGDDEPLGILTHHLRHEAESWNLLEELFALLAHPAADWPAIPRLFPRD